MTADVQLAVASLCFAIASWRGAAPERLLAAGMVCSLLLPWIDAQLASGEAVGSHEPGRWVWLELLWFAGLCRIAVRANRMYPLCIGAAQIVALSAHWVHAFERGPTHPACQLIQQVAHGVALLSLAIGLGSHIVRERRLGRSYASWCCERGRTV